MTTLLMTLPQLQVSLRQGKEMKKGRKENTNGNRESEATEGNAELGRSPGES